MKGIVIKTVEEYIFQMNSIFLEWLQKNCTKVNNGYYHDGTNFAIGFSVKEVRKLVENMMMEIEVFNFQELPKDREDLLSFQTEDVASFSYYFNEYIREHEELYLPLFFIKKEKDRVQISMPQNEVNLNLLSYLKEHFEKKKETKKPKEKEKKNEVQIKRASKPRRKTNETSIVPEIRPEEKEKETSFRLQIMEYINKASCLFDVQSMKEYLPEVPKEMIEKVVRECKEIEFIHYIPELEKYYNPEKVDSSLDPRKKHQEKKEADQEQFFMPTTQPKALEEAKTNTALTQIDRNFIKETVREIKGGFTVKVVIQALDLFSYSKEQIVLVLEEMLSQGEIQRISKGYYKVVVKRENAKLDEKRVQQICREILLNNEFTKKEIRNKYRYCIAEAEEAMRRVADQFRYHKKDETYYRKEK